MNNKCELCNAEAAVFCPSDAAFLCCSCDAKVHQANFIVARHVRRPICSDSHSTITSSLKRPRNSVTRAEAILFNWCYKLGIEDGTVVRTACRTMRSVDRWTGLPFRVSLAASMWVSLGKSAVTLKVLKRLEVISGVPAKVILASGCKLERAAVEQRCPVDLEEGWAEC